MRQRIVLYVILILAAIGILQSWRHLLIPIVVFGIVGFFLIFPPNRLKSMFRQATANSRKRKRHVKKAKFRVIHGSKRQDDEPPKYH